MENVIFANDAELTIVDYVEVNDLKINEGLHVTTNGNLSIFGDLILGAGATFSYSGATSLSFTEQELINYTTANASIVVGADATLTLTDKQTSENNESSAFDKVSGVGNVVLNLSADNGVGFNFSNLAGDITIATGRLQVNKSSFNEASTIYLEGSASHLVFHDNGTELKNNVVLGATTNIYVNDQKTGIISGVISGDAGFVKEGAGVLTLTTQNTYTGTTTINKGKIVLNTGTEYVLLNHVLYGTLEIAEGTTLNSDAKQISSHLVLNQNAGFTLNTDLTGSQNSLQGSVTVNAGATMLLTGSGHNAFKADAAKSLTVDGGLIDFGTTLQTLTNWGVTLKNGAKLTGEGGMAENAAYNAALVFNGDTTITVDSGENSIESNICLSGGNDRTLTLNVQDNAGVGISGRIHAGTTTALGNILKSGGGAVTLSSQAMFNQLSVEGGSVALEYSGPSGNVINHLAMADNTRLILHAGTKLRVCDSLSGGLDSIMVLQKGARLDSPDISFSNRGETVATLKSLDADTAFTTESATFEFVSGYMTTKAQTDVILDSKLLDTALENAGSGKVTLVAEGNDLCALYAINGDIEWLNGAQGNLSELVVYSGHNISLYNGAEANVEEIGNITLSGRGEIADAATLNANLELLEGAELAITDMSSVENSVSGAVHSLSGSGNVVLHLASSHNGVGFNFADYTGGIQLVSGNLLVHATSLHEDASLCLNSESARLVFDATGTELSNHLELGADAQIQVNVGKSGIISGVISGEHSLLISGDGALTLGVQNTYTGQTIINSGKLVFASGGNYELNNTVSGGTIEVASGTTLLNNGHAVSSDIILQDASAIKITGSNTLNSTSLTVADNGTAELYVEEAITISSGMLKVDSGAVLNLEGKAYTFADDNGFSEESAGTLNIFAERFGIASAATTTFYANVNIRADSTLNLPRGSGHWATAGLNLSSTMTIAEGKTLTVTGNARMQINDGGVLVLEDGATVDRTEDGAYYIKGSLATAEDATAVFKSVNDIHLNYINNDYNLSDTGGSIDVAKDSTLKLSVKNLQSYGKAVINVGENAMLDASGTNAISLSGDTSVNMEQGGSFKVKDKVTFSNRGAADTATLKGNGAYGMGASAYELKDGHLCFYADSQATIKNKLTNSSVQNDSEHVLRLDNAGNTLSGVFAESGDIILQNQSTHTLQELKLATELTLSAYKGSTETPENEAHITVQKCAEFGVSTTLNANLLMEAGSELKMHGTVSMGSDLTIEAGVMLTGAQYEALGGLINDGVSKVVLFKGIDTLYLGTVAQTESITLEDQLLASTYFSNLENTDYLLVYDASEPGNGILSIMVPEPASSTLSLLALAAMVARRRRRK